MSRQSAIDAAQCPWRVAGPITTVGTPVPVKCTAPPSVPPLLNISDCNGTPISAATVSIQAVSFGGAISDTRNYTSFYGMNMLSIVLFLPIVILCFASVLFFIYDITFNFERYLDTWRYRADSELMLHIAYCAIFFMSFVFAAILNYFIFAPRHYPIRFNRKTGKVYICDYILNDMSHKSTYTFWWHYPFYKHTKPEYKEYDWEQIQGIAFFAQNRHSSYSTIRCIVYESLDSTNIIDTFNLITTESAIDALHMTNHKLWLWINSFMNFDDEFLEKSINTAPGIWGREVNWPEDMNKKSMLSSMDEYIL